MELVDSILPTRDTDRPAGERLSKLVLNPPFRRDPHHLVAGFYELLRVEPRNVGRGLGLELNRALIGSLDNWIRQHRDVAIILLPGHGLIQLADKGHTAPHQASAHRDFLHREFGGDPRATGQRPAVAGVHREAQAQPLRFLRGMNHQFPPRLGKRICRGGDQRAAMPDGHYIGTAHSGFRHRFEVTGDALARHIGVQPIPIHPRLGVFPWLAERVRQRGRWAVLALWP